MFGNPGKRFFSGLGRERRCVMRLAILSLAFAGILAFGATFAVAADVAANMSAIPYVTASADTNSALTPVQWVRYPRVYRYSYPYYGYAYPNYGYAYPNYGYSYQPYYTYSPQYYQYSTPNYGYYNYSYPYSAGYYSPNGVYYQAARPYYYGY
jgi:hypothetical protein